MTVNVGDVAVETVPISSLRMFPGNARRGDVERIAESLRQLGQYRPLVVNGREGGRYGDRCVLAGNHTLQAAEQLGWEDIAVQLIDVDDETAWRINLVDNRSADLGTYDDGALLALLRQGRDWGFDATGWGEDDLERMLAESQSAEAEEAETRRAAERTLAERFIVPPFSVLDARAGYWQERKRAWIDLGIRSEIGRGDNLIGRSPQELLAHYSEMTYREVAELAEREGIERIRERLDAVLREKGMGGARTNGGRQAQHVNGLLMTSDSGNDPAYYWKKQAAERRLGRELTTEEFQRDHYQGPDAYEGGTSIFDPVLCEVVYRWFCPPGGSVLDPFAGGSVRGIVAARLGLSYTGIDLSERQLAANVEQAAAILGDETPHPPRPAPVETPPEPEPETPHAAIAEPEEEPVRIDLATRRPAEEEALVPDAPSPIPEADPAPEPEPPPAPPEPSGMKPWQKGYPMEVLRPLARMFQGHDEGLVLGAFTGVKENNVAGWLHEGRLRVYAEEEGGPPVAAAVIAESRSQSQLKDFSGFTRALVPAGDVQVKRVACLPGHEGALLRLIADELGYLQGRGESIAPPEEPPRAAFFELWQEHPTDRGIARALGLVWVCTKIRASSELVGVWTNRKQTLQSERVPPEEHLSLARLDLKLAAEVEELGRALDRGLSWQDHYSGYNKGHSWSAVALRGFGGDPEFIIKPTEMSRKWQQENLGKLGWEVEDTPLRATLPEAEPLIEAIPGEKERIRLMRLGPGGGELTRHADITDHAAGVAEGRIMRIHVPIRTNPDVIFETWDLDGRRLQAHMAEGEAWYLDMRKPHTAVNGGESERIHLVIDVHASDDLLVLVDDQGQGLQAADVIEPRSLEPSQTAVPLDIERPA
jgi:hypothetical protein